MAWALHDNSQHPYCLPADCLIVKSRVPVLTFLSFYRTFPHPSCHMRQVRQWRFPQLQMRKQSLGEVRASSNSPPWGPNQGLWSPVLLKFCHSEQKPLKWAKINQTGKRPVVCPEKNSTRTWVEGLFFYGHNSYRKSLSFGTCYIIVVHCWWYLIFPVIKIHLRNQLSSFVPSQIFSDRRTLSFLRSVGAIYCWHY